MQKSGSGRPRLDGYSAMQPKMICWQLISVNAAKPLPGFPFQLNL